MQAKLSTMFQSLQVRNYRLFASGQLIKLIGVWMMFIAQDWLVLELSDNSATALGVVTALQFTPVLLLTLLSGRLADRYDKRVLLFVANAFWTVLALGMAVLVLTDLVQLWHVFAFAALLGTANAVETPVRQAFVSELVEPALLPNALGLTSASFNSARIVGPALAGMGIWLIGLGPIFLVTAVCYLVPLFFVLRIQRSQLYGVGPDGVAGYGHGSHQLDRRAARKARGEARIRDGLAYVWRRQDLVVPLALLLVMGLFGFNFQLTLAVMAKNVFGTGAQQFGLLTTCLAVGALIGALVSGSRRSRPSFYTVVGSAAVFGLLEVIVGFAPTFWSTAVLLLPNGFFMIFFAQAANQRLQLSVDPEFRGRVMSLFVLVFLGATPIGAPLIGVVSEHLGPRVGIWGGGLICFVAALGILAWHLRRSGERLRVTLHPLPHVEVVPASARAL